MKQQKEYGEVMRYFLRFRDRYASDAEFNKFVVESLRTLVYDLRDIDVYISVNPESLKWSRTVTQREIEITRSTVC